METLDCVQHRQRVEQGHEQRDDPRFSRRLGQAANRVAEGCAFQERHDHVGRSVGLPKTVDLEQRRVVELGEQTRLVDEAPEAGIERLLVPSERARISVCPTREAMLEGMYSLSATLRCSE